MATMYFLPCRSGKTRTYTPNNSPQGVPSPTRFEAWRENVRQADASSSPDVFWRRLGKGMAGVVNSGEQWQDAGE